jgi:hypothetical protein
MADPTAWTMVDAGHVAGQTIVPAPLRAGRRHRGQADIGSGLAVPVFGPDVS